MIIHCISARLKARCTPFKADNAGYFTVQAWWPGRLSAAKPKARIRNIATRPLPALGGLVRARFGFKIRELAGEKVGEVRSRY